MSESFLCLDCAQRLGCDDAPQIPELLDGYCPQCGSSHGLKAQPVRSFAEFPTEPAPQPHTQAA